MTELRLWTSEANGEVKIRQTESGPASRAPITVMETFYKCVKNNGSKPALHQKIVPSVSFNIFYIDFLNLMLLKMTLFVIFIGKRCNRYSLDYMDMEKLFIKR